MGIYRIIDNELRSLQETTYQSEGMLERRDLQSLIRDSIEIIDPNLMVLAEEFGGWEDSRRRIDLLCMDRDARIVVLELKRTEDGGHMDLQAIRYAAMVSKMTFSAAVEAHRSFLKRLGRNTEKAENSMLEFLNWDEPQEEAFGNDVRLVLASAEFAKELMTTVIWLSEHDIDITCIRLKPYKFENDVVLNVEQIFPLREAADYQVRIREKERRERQARSSNRDLTRYHLMIGDTRQTNLPKLRLAYAIVREAVDRGSAPRNVLTMKRAWVGVDGELSSETFLEVAATQRDAESPSAHVRDFFTGDGELFHFGGKTYALRGNMWGPNTLAELDRIIEDFNLNDVSYEAAA